MRFSGSCVSARDAAPFTIATTTAPRAMGVVDYITKPFSPDAILALTSYTLEKHGGSAQRTSMDNVLVPPQPLPPPEEPTLKGHPPEAARSRSSSQNPVLDEITSKSGTF